MGLFKKLRFVHLLLFIAYLTLLMYLVLFSEEFGRVAVSRDYNLVPFDTIKRYFNYRSYFGDLYFITNIYGNILAFAPFGYFLFVLEKRHHILKGLLLPALLSLLIEISQYYLSVGSFDVDDIILNTLGGLLVYGILLVVLNVITKRKSIRST